MCECEWAWDCVRDIAAGMALISHTSNVVGSGNEFPFSRYLLRMLSFGFVLFSSVLAAHIPISWQLLLTYKWALGSSVVVWLAKLGSALLSLVP